MRQSNGPPLVLWVYFRWGRKTFGLYFFLSKRSRIPLLYKLPKKEFHFFFLRKSRSLNCLQASPFILRTSQPEYIVKYIASIWSINIGLYDNSNQCVNRLIGQPTNFNLIHFCGYFRLCKNRLGGQVLGLEHHRLECHRLRSLQTRALKPIST